MQDEPVAERRLASPCGASDRHAGLPPQPQRRRQQKQGLGGTLSLICGCMFSGKTSELLKRFSAAPSQTVLAFKHIIDQRYHARAVVSHAGLSWPALPVASAAEILAQVTPEVTLVGIDEGHFFELDLLEVTQELRRRGHGIVVTSLDRSSHGHPFPVVEQLVGAAEELIVKYAVCARCGRLATCTQRLTPIVDRDMVGGPESYEPRCFGCWRPPPQARVEPPPNSGGRSGQ